MRRVLIVLLGVLALAALPIQAEAGRGSGHHGRGGHGYSSGHHRSGGHGYSGSHSYRGGHGYSRGHGYRRGHRGHHGNYYSFWLAPFAWGSRWYPAYYGYAYRQQPTVVVEERVVYVERPTSAAPAENWWYYCESAAAYYPEVDSCPENWLKVPPRPESKRSPY